MRKHLNKLGKRLENVKEAVARKLDLAVEATIGHQRELHRTRVLSALFDRYEGLQDHLGLTTKPLYAESFHPEIALRKMLPEATQKRFFDTLKKHFPEEGSYGVQHIVGSDETKHPHEFLVENDGKSYTFYLLDPEQTVGNRTLLRPRIIQIIALRLSFNEHDQPQFAMGRLRTAKLTPQQQQNYHKLSYLAQVAPGFLEHSSLPDLSPEDANFLMHIDRSKAQISDAHSFAEDDLMKSINDPKAPLTKNARTKAFFLQHILKIVERLAKQKHFKKLSSRSDIPRVDEEFGARERT